MPVVAPTGPRLTRVVDAELREPAPKGGLREVFAQPYLLRLIVRRELAQMYSASLLGLLWSYVQPAMRFAVYYVVMGFILGCTRGSRTSRSTCSPAWWWSTTSARPGTAAPARSGRTGPWSRRCACHARSSPSPRWWSPATTRSRRCWCSCWPASSPAGRITWTSVAALLLGLGILTTFAGALALFFSALNVFYRDFQNIVGTVHAVHALHGADDLPLRAHLRRARRPPGALPDLRRQPGRPGGHAVPALLLVPPGRGPAPRSASAFPPDSGSAG